jgi:hypothetical protein
MVHRILDHVHYVAIGDRVDHRLAVPPPPDEPRLQQYLQTSGNGTGLVSFDVGQVTDVAFAPRENDECLQAGWIGQRLEHRSGFFEPLTIDPTGHARTSYGALGT